MEEIENYDINNINNKQIKKFVQDEIDHCTQHKIKVQLKNSETVAFNGAECGGYFMDEPNLLLAVAIGKDPETWLPVFVHETCHKDQYVEKDPVWDLKIKEYFNAGDIFDMWLNHAVELTKSQLKEVLKQVMLVEIDCEKRSLEKIKRYNLPINHIEYIQKSNAYIFYYHAIARKREWGSKDAPYENPKIWQEMPVDFNQDYSKINRNMLNLFFKHCW